MTIKLWLDKKLEVSLSSFRLQKTFVFCSLTLLLHFASHGCSEGLQREAKTVVQCYCYGVMWSLKN